MARFEVARRLGLATMPTMQLDHLTPAQVLAYRIADNRIAELSEWNEEVLRLDVADLVELEVTGELEFSLGLRGFSTPMRFPVEVLRAVRAVWSEDRPLGLRISGRDWLDGGLEPDDAIALAIRRKQEAVGFVCVSSGAITPKAVPSISSGYRVSSLNGSGERLALPHAQRAR